MNNLKPLARRVILGISIGLVILMLADLNSRIMEMTRLSREHGRVAVQSTALIQTKVVAQEKVVQATSEAVVRDWAYTTGRYIEPGKGEYLVVIVPSGGTSEEPTPAAAAPPEPLETWEVWWALFFDAPMP